jgi:hypothetical protein
LNEYLAYVVMAVVLMLGYAIGRWHGALRERDAYRDLIASLHRERRERRR